MQKALMFFGVLVCAGYSYSAALPDDPALSTPVTLGIKGEALTDIMAMLEEQTGVRLRAARDIADHKATIFVDEKPLREVMEGLATLFNYHWSRKRLNDRQVYDLWEDEKSRLEREYEWQKAWTKACKEVATQIELKARFGAMTKEEQDSLRAKLTADLAKGSNKEAKVQLEALETVQIQPLSGACAHVYTTSVASMLEPLQPGISVYYDWESSEPEWQLSDDIVRYLLDRMGSSAAPTGEAENVEPDGFSLSFSVGSPTRAVDIRASVSPEYRRGRSSYFKSRYVTLGYKRMMDVLPTPKDLLPHDSPAEALERKVALSMSDLAHEAGLPWQWTGGSRIRVNRSDVLSLLHDRLGLQIISDHYSYWYRWKAPREESAREIVESFQGLAAFLGYAFEARWGWDGKFLFMRTRDVRYSDAAEVPNRLLRPWQAVYAAQGYLGLTELAEASQLTDEQHRGLCANAHFLGLGSRLAKSPVLRLYRLLTERQREEAFAGGTSVAAFTPQQREVLTAILPNRSSKGVRVGIYKGRRRIDKPERPDPVSAEPILFEIREAGAGPAVPGESGEAGVIVGTGASKSIPEDHQEAKDGVVRPREIKYEMALTFASGSGHVSYISVPVGKPDPKPADEAK